MRAFFYIRQFRLEYALLFSLLFCGKLVSQTENTIYPYVTKIPEGFRVTATVVGTDTVPCIWMPWVIVSDKMPFATRKKYAEWTRLKQNVKRVYPYAILAAAKLKEYDLALAKIPKECDRKAYLKKSEKELQKQFGEELKGLSINQGRILMKLIDRETGKTTYTIVKEMRGNFNAFMWQSLASLFGSSMKQEYDLNNPEDKLIEVAVKQIEAGEF